MRTVTRYQAAARTAWAADIARVDLDIWSTTATVLVTEPPMIGQALDELNHELTEIDAACSRFRPDSEINRLLARPGTEIELSSVLNDAMTEALRVARATGYLVDPTVGAAVIAAGYDRDIAEVVARSAWQTAYGPSGAAPGAWRIRHDPASARIELPPGIGIDLGASAKAMAADRAAARISGRLGCGVLVGIGGDIAVSGGTPHGGWRIAIGDDHRAACSGFFSGGGGTAATHQVVAISSGGLATSSTATRRWRTPTGWAHHIIDPRTGRNPLPMWRTAAVAAASCLDANAASTAAIVLGPDAVPWLRRNGLPALLVDETGSVTTVAGWPAERDALTPAVSWAAGEVQA